MVDVERTSDEPAVLQAASTRSDIHCTCKASLQYEVWYGYEALKTAKRTSCSICTGKVFPKCECACASASCSWS